MLDQARMPDATPRNAAGTAFITDAVFGAANTPCDTPSSRSNPANTG